MPGRHYERSGRVEYGSCVGHDVSDAWLFRCTITFHALQLPFLMAGAAKGPSVKIDVWQVVFKSYSEGSSERVSALNSLLVILYND